MKTYGLLVSPLARAAFFEQYLDVSKVELALVDGVELVQTQKFGDMDMLIVRAPETRLLPLARLSFVQGIFDIEADAIGVEGSKQMPAWRPLSQTAEFLLHQDFVWGEKYKGKTNETLTQLALNLALSVADPAAEMRLLDPMCGRGTSCFWAMRYGLSAVGIEQDPQALAEIRRGVKKWTKLHRQKHKLNEGWNQKANKSGVGKFLEFTAAGSSAKFVTGDAQRADTMTHKKPFDLIVTDIPYGVQHMGGKNSRSPLETIQNCAPVWMSCLRKGGAMAIAYNSNIPKKDQMIAAFDGLGGDVIDIPVAHRMSESIVRDILVLKKA